ncbi:MAG: right-handed parallel beta-helix repeat-containing protein [Desulfobacterales bacterium]|nr:right-handed parallel beta-helix repeat-containing protein [Desulfobacterales bacterium]
MKLSLPKQRSDIILYMSGWFCIPLALALFFFYERPNSALAQDWVVNGTELVENDSIVLAGNLVVEDGGTLTLRAVNLTMNNSYNGEYGLRVKSGGTLTIEGGSAVTATADSGRFSFAVESGATFLMRDSELHRCGWGSDTEELGDKATILSGIRGLVINTNNAVIEGSTLSNNHVGIILTGSDITLDNNNIHSNKVHGIYIRDGTTCQITNNTVQHSSIGSPFRMVDAEDNIVQGNTISLSMIHRGNVETMWSHRNLFKNNTISGLGMGIVLMFVSNENQVIDNTISIDEAGIMVWGWNNLIQNNTISSTVESPATGIFIVYAYNTMVSDNDISGVIGDGIWLRHSSNNSILRNLASASTGSSSVLLNGVLLQSHSGKNIIHGNQLNEFSRGISIFYESNENKVVSNQFSRTSSLAAIIDGSNSNLLYGNSFLEMEGPPYDTAENRWDNEGRGNYWSKYSGTDGNDDGIGDEPYAIPPKGVDNFPLMKPVSVGSLPAPEIEPAIPPQMESLFSKTVTGTEVIQNQKIVLAGISVESGGSLILRNVEIITGASDRCSDLGVASGGSLKIYDSKITHLSNGYGFQFQPSKGSVFVMSGTELQVCGHEWPYGGLQIYTDNALIENSVLKNSQMTFFNVSGGRIQGNTISQSREGIRAPGKNQDKKFDRF